MTTWIWAALIGSVLHAGLAIDRAQALACIVDHVQKESVGGPQYIDVGDATAEELVAWLRERHLWYWNVKEVRVPDGSGDLSITFR